MEWRFAQVPLTLWGWLPVAGCSFSWEVFSQFKMKKQNDIFFKVHGFPRPMGN
jgi:hypothetical protein